MRPVEPWILDPDVAYLNHGAFGACPRPVLEAQQRWRVQLEANPNRFFLETYVPALDAARVALAAFLGADPAGLVFVRNATEGVNAVVRSLEPELGAGDELLVTDHAYNACRNALDVTAERTGAGVVVAHVPFPIGSPDQALEAILDAAGGRTRLVLIDRVTSPTALIFPVERVIAALEPDVPVLVDAAHAPGMVPLALDASGASFTAGNCHKWLCAPKGAGFLHVRADMRERILPTVVSHGWNRVFRPSASRFQAMFDWAGTGDPSAWLVVPDAIRTVASLVPGGWPELMARNHQLALAARDLLCDALDVAPPAPDEMIGAMAALPLPDAPPSANTTQSDWGDEDVLGDRLRRRGIEVPVFPWPRSPSRLVRVSAQLYNRIDDYERLSEALAVELGDSSAVMPGNRGG
jgi:isopenicillin-N epimerase